jgi:hypothetical protein
MTEIKHIVISAGGGSGLSFYGILRESFKAGFWNFENLETVHSTSVGAIIMVAIPIVQTIGWDSCDDFLIKRPWERLFEISTEKLMNSYKNVGVFGEEVISQTIQPLLSSVDLSLNTTLKEFYEFSGIETHWYLTNLDEYRLEDVSYKTHPDWTILQATYGSCALPFMFKPCVVGGVSYSDGGFFCGYPMIHCVKNVENTDEIFGICKNGYDKNKPNTKKTEYGNMMDYLTDIVLKTIDCLEQEKVDNVKNVICISDEIATMMSIIQIFKTAESRRRKIEEGVVAWNKFQQGRDSTC